MAGGAATCQRQLAQAEGCVAGAHVLEAHLLHPASTRQLRFGSGTLVTQREDVEKRPAKLAAYLQLGLTAVVAKVKTQLEVRLCMLQPAWLIT